MTPFRKAWSIYCSAPQHHTHLAFAVAVTDISAYYKVAKAGMVRELVTVDCGKSLGAFGLVKVALQPDLLKNVERVF